MGQFASKAFDGDPYIEIMRVLPDKELCWWIQKVIWVAEGFTLVEHFGRTYPQLFIYKCEACNGAGTVTCPHCNGYKVKRASSYNGFRLSEQTTVGRLLATAGTQECDHCGGYCQWDAESEWQGMWEDWERKLAYYDRSFGKVMDNWYEDVVNEGNLDQDTPQPEEPAPGPEDTSIMAQLDRDVEKMPMRTKALMQRFGGHPYENFDMIPYQILDPTKPLEENVDRMGMDYNWLPPELDPQGFPEYLLQANNPIAQFEHQIRMEYLILNNLDAAIKDQPKPAQFGPSAGTVLCPDCLGKPHGWSFAPNVSKLFRAEPPFWLRTLARMDALGTPDVSASSYRQSRSLTGSSADQGAGSQQQQDAASFSNGRGGRKRFGEVPHQPYKDIEIQAALESSGNLWHYNPRSRSVQGETSDQEYGPMDPLSYAPQSTLKNPEQELGHVMGKANPITGKAAAEAHRVYHNLNPAKNLARKIRDVQQLGKASTPEEMEAAMDWLRTRESVAGDL